MFGSECLWGLGGVVVVDVRHARVAAADRFSVQCRVNQVLQLVHVVDTLVD